MLWMRQQGLDAAVCVHAAQGGAVLGICGGFQMLGERVDDPDGLEGQCGSSTALGLLDMTTTLVAGKQLREVHGSLNLPASTAAANTAFSGYEMHNGVSQGPALLWPLATINGNHEGDISADNQIAGTYVHGIFDQPSACDALLQWAGLDGADNAVDYQQHRLAQLDRLADQVEQCLDTDWLRDLLGLNPSTDCGASTAP